MSLNKRAVRAERERDKALAERIEQIAAVIDSHLALEDDNSGYPIIIGIDDAAREIAALPPLAAAREEVILECIAVVEKLSVELSGLTRQGGALDALAAVRAISKAEEPNG